MPAALLVCHIPGTRAKRAPHSAGPRAKASFLPQQHTNYSKEGFTRGLMTTSPIISTLVLQSLHAPLGPLAGFGSTRVPVLPASQGPRCGKRARMEQVLWLCWRRDFPLWCFWSPLSAFSFFLLLLLLINTYNFLIGYFATWFSQNRCNQQQLRSLAQHKCLRRFTVGPRIGCNIRNL